MTSRYILPKYWHNVEKKQTPVMNWNEQETVDKENTIHEMMYAEYFSVQQILKYSQVYKRVTM